MRKLYSGIDLHSNNSHVGILDQNDTRIYHKRLPNQPDVILSELEPYKENLMAIVVESTFNWYWLVGKRLSNHTCVSIAIQLLPCNIPGQQSLVVFKQGGYRQLLEDIT